MGKLTEQQKLFCLEYLKDLNGTQAAKRAGYRGNENVLGVTANGLLRNPKIEAFVQERMNKRSQRVELTADLILRELLKLATVDTSKAYGPDGKLLPIHQIPEDVRMAIKSFETYEDFTEGVEVGVTQKITWWDKNKSLELLGKHLKLFTDVKETHNTYSLEYARDVSQQPDDILIETAQRLTKKLEGK